MEYDPFGGRRQPFALASPVSPPSTRSFGFTGHEPDDEFHLINMGGRIYDPSTTRFLTPDPFVQAPLTHSLNRYAYVYNNPVNFVDPTGFQTDLGISWSDYGSDGGIDGDGRVIRVGRFKFHLVVGHQLPS